MRNLKIKKTVRNIPDQHNLNKIWVISHTECGHYYVTQIICGRQCMNKVRMTRKQLKDMFPDWY